MAKIVVVDSLARSGTTLLSAILNSQERVTSYRGAFHELMACRPASWPHGYARFPLVNGDVHVDAQGEKWKPHRLTRHRVPRRMIDFYKRAIFSGSVRLSWPDLQQSALDRIDLFNQTGKIELSDWQHILDIEVRDLKDIDQMYQNIAEKTGSEVVCFRWNQGLPYIQKWLQREQHLWIAMIRHPMDRACSAKKSHGWTWEDSLEDTAAYYKLLDQVKGMEGLLIVYYEDFIDDPEGEMRRILNHASFEADSINLTDVRGQDNKAYRVESSDLVEQHGTHKVGKEYKGINKGSLDRWQREMPQSVQQEFINRLAKLDVLERYF